MQPNDWRVAVEVNKWIDATCKKEDLRMAFSKLVKAASIDELYAIAGYLTLTSATDSDDQLMIVIMDELVSRGHDVPNYLPPILQSLKPCTSPTPVANTV